MRVTMGKVREGLEERGSWWGMKRMVGESFFSADWVVVASVVAADAGGEEAVGDEGRADCEAVEALGRVIEGEGDSTWVDWGCVATLDRPL